MKSDYTNMKGSFKKPILILLGPPGSFSDLASRKLEKKFEKRYVSSFKKIFKKLHAAKKIFAFIPVKNKIVGDVEPCATEMKKNRYAVVMRLTFDVRLVIAKKRSPLKVAGKARAKSNLGIPAGLIKKIYVPAVAYEQCKKYLAQKYPGVKVQTNADATSASYKKIVQLKGFSAAAIGSLEGAKMAKLQIIERNIQDDPQDWTEFVVCSAERA